MEIYCAVVFGTTSRNPNFPVSQIDNSKAQRFEGVANQSVTSGTVGTSGWDKIRSWVNAICLACIIAGCFVVGVDLMTKANPDARKSIAVIETRFDADEADEVRLPERRAARPREQQRRHRDIIARGNLGRPSSGGKGECRRCPTARQGSRP